MAGKTKTLRVIDSHTGGEPTRVLVEGGPDLGQGSMSERLKVFNDNSDDYRRALVNEPRGSDVMVGALLQTPKNSENTAGLIFFNNEGYLGMCGHGAMGFLVTLGYLGIIEHGKHRIETPVGVIEAVLEDDNTVVIQNVPAYREKKGISLEIPNIGTLNGDLAWGGNWFFFCGDHGLDLSYSNIKELDSLTKEIRRVLLEKKHITAEQDNLLHVELYSPSKVDGIGIINYVMCPGGEYDRSPCGTGTSAKMACLYADGKLKSGELWRQESIIGSIFEGWVNIDDNENIIPFIKGKAYVNSESKIILNPEDPYMMGIKG
jgi:4-hydroxyproline epimerase